jgi:MFS transporter, OFA family, oxalate/formate antiporter
VLAETWLVPLEGYLIDRIGPKLMVAAGGALVGSGWLINSRADSLFLLRLQQSFRQTVATGMTAI